MVELPDSIRGRLDELQGQAARVGASSAAMRARIAELEGESGGLHEEQGRLNGRIAELEAENERIRHLQTENDQLVGRHSALADELRAMLERMEQGA